MSLNNFSKKITAILALLTLLSPVVVLAASGIMEGVSETCSKFGNCAFEDLLTVVVYMYNFFRDKVAFTVAVAMIIYGGGTMVLSGSNSSRVSQGKKILTSAIIGFSIVVGVGLIMNATLMILTGQSIEWLQFIFQNI